MLSLCLARRLSVCVRGADGCMQSGGPRAPCPGGQGGAKSGGKRERRERQERGLWAHAVCSSCKHTHTPNTQGIVRNVVDFGAFIDIGVRQRGTAYGRQREALRRGPA